MIRFVTSYALLFTASVMVTFTAHADIGAIGGNIGKIGSPVVPSNLPKPAPKGNKATKQADDDTDDDKESPKERPLLLDISFSQNRVDFQAALKMAIMQNEKSAPGAVYEVVSSIPDNSASPSKAARLNGIYATNLNMVVQQMLAMGLPPNRIHTSTTYKDNGSDQDVNIYGAPQ